MVGFGVDAAIDSAASIVLVWRFTIESNDPGGADRVEKAAERLIAIVLMLAATALVVGALRSLLLHGEPQTSVVQVALLLVSVAALPPLAYAKRRVAIRLSSNALRQDALLTAAAAALAAVALVAGQLGPAIGLSWADAAGTLVIAAVLAREGLAIVRGSRG
jgi:divalent metal cation (Fe/Co/Zn/Cd) transporter